MFININTKQYKFKLDNVTITVDLDNSFHNYKFQYESGTMPYIKHHHYHMAHELFFIEENPITLLTDSNVTEYKNCILSIPPKFYHMSLRQNDYRIIFSFSHDKDKNSNFSKFLKSLADSTNPQKLIVDSHIISCLKELSSILVSKNSMCEEITTAILKVIFYKIYALNSPKQSDTITSINESYILKIDKIINSFQNDINLQTVADYLHLSTKQTSRVIAKTYNKRLSELLNEKRLSVACHLLRYTDKNISEIVEYINFSSESYFHLQFKKKYGCTPYKYKKMNASEIKTK